jgi:pilus assembly protein CpaF
MEGDIIIVQDLLRFDVLGEEASGGLIGRHRFTGISRPRFAERARYFGLEQRLTELLAGAERAETTARTGGGFG